jgi:uncharacterized RDD family membrane protein YckC
MSTIKIDTSQNIEIEQPIASIGERIAATLLDFLFMMGYSFLVSMVFIGFHDKTFIIIALTPLSFYGLISELAMNGQTWGKKIMKIKVVKIDGTPTTFLSYFLRWITGLIEIFVSFGSIAMITIILNQKGQRIGDIAANTTVIRLREKSLKETIYTQVADDYTVVYPETARLSTSDIYTIQEVLELLNTPYPSTQSITIAQRARNNIEKKIGVKSELKTRAFFQTILRDYNCLNRG